MTAPTCVKAGIHRRGALVLGRHCLAGRAKHRAANIVGEGRTPGLSTRGAIEGDGRKRMYANEGVKEATGRFQEA